MIIDRVYMKSASLVLLLQCADAFVTPNAFLHHTASTRQHHSLSSQLYSAVEPQPDATSAVPVTPSTTVGLITFDLDDTLYPIATVIDEANAAFARTMAKFGYDGIDPDDIDITGRTIRHELEENGDESATTLSHTEIRELAIRKELEKAMLARKLQETADEWATQVSYLADVVKQYATKWASTAVSDSVVNSIVTAWEMERHHAAERHLYPEVLEALDEIKAKYPNVIIGAVTDGKANPMFMTFTLAKYFDFCMSWEDDQGMRSKFFKELGSVEGNAELSWIYNAAKDKYQEMKKASAAIAEASGAVPSDQEAIWIHVGDDLAYDVGGSAACGAKTILVELADKYGQTARHRFDDLNDQPNWSTSSKIELTRRSILNVAALDHVDEKISFLSQLPEAVDRVLESVDKDE